MRKKGGRIGAKLTVSYDQLGAIVVANPGSRRYNRFSD
jgi:hypothetical protein